MWLQHLLHRTVSKAKLWLYLVKPSVCEKCWPLYDAKPNASTMLCMWLATPRFNFVQAAVSIPENFILYKLAPHAHYDKHSNTVINSLVLLVDCSASVQACERYMCAAPIIFVLLAWNNSSFVFVYPKHFAQQIERLLQYLLATAVLFSAHARWTLPSQKSWCTEF